MRAPALSLVELQAILIKNWGVHGLVRCQEKASYDDRLYVLSGDNPTQQYICKVHNAVDSATPGFLEAQDGVLLHLAQRGFPVNLPLPLVGQSSTHTVRLPLGPDGRLYGVRVLSYLPGVLLVDATQSLHLYSHLGALLAGVDAALLEYEDKRLIRENDWVLACLPATFPRLRPQLKSMKPNVPSADMQLLDEVVAHFSQVMAAATGELREAIIHADANERNVVVDAAMAAAAAAAAAESSSSTGEEGSLVSGLLDFGDCCHQWLAAEVGIAMVYVMLLECNADCPLPAGAALLRGYESVLPLLPVERQVLRTLVVGRLVQSLSLGLLSAAAMPDNADYLLGTQRAGWSVLRKVWALSDDAFLYELGSPEAINK